MSHDDDDEILSNLSAVKISKFRIRFDLKKNLGKNPNKCVIKIDGLAPVTPRERP